MSGSWTIQDTDPVERNSCHHAMADGRMDSPGFCAQYCTYTIMENYTKEILSIVNIDKRETQRSSVIMEKEGFIRSFNKLCQEVKLAEWNKDICNHFWYCCKMAENDEFFDMWIGLLHHVTGEHEWSLDACQHGPLEEEREKEWLGKGSLAHEVLSEIVLSERWLKEVHKYLHFSKRFSFSPPVYEARILLAGLDYNHHVHRPPKRIPDGSIEYCKLYNKKSRKWSLYTIKQEKDYSYIPDLQRAIIRKRCPQDVVTHVNMESCLVYQLQPPRSYWRHKSAGGR
ncbi:PREDICTED: uncharacterized protein LOC106529025%2C partial, partial [Scomber scombrus]